MPEVFEIADNYTILRNGRFIKSGSISDTTPEEITRYMVGESLSTREMYEKRQFGEIVLQLEKLSGVAFSEIDLTVRKGEILGLTGLQGAGCSEVLQTVFGALKAEHGSILIHEKEVKSHSIHQAMKKHVAMIATNRKENSILPDMTLLENTCIAEHNINYRQQHIFRNREIKKYEEFKTMLNIKAESPNILITSLSGGNMQKVVLARMLKTQADILLFDNPTQGIDVGAKSEIYKLILELSKSGKTVIINTLEIPEIQRIADR